MLNGVKTVTLFSISKYGRVPWVGDVHVNFYGKNINDGCHVSELRYGYGAEFKLTLAEIETLENLARNLYYNEPMYNTYEINLTTNKMKKLIVEVS